MTSLRNQTRTEFSVAVKKAAFRRCCKDSVPYCEGCGNMLKGGRPIYEHVTPDGLGGEPTLENCKVHCKTCADVKTATEDNPRMAKADRQLKSAFGISRKGPKIQSRGFQKSEGQRSATRPLERRT